VADAVMPSKSIAQSQWWVQVRGRAFGPYNIDRIAQFMSEGRVKPSTLLSDKPDGAWTEARRIMSLRGLRTPTPANDVAANVVVHAEIVSGAFNAFVAGLESLGFICELANGLWLLRTRQSVGTIRNTLSQTLEMGDRFIVVDATRDRLAWFNLGPDVDVRIAKVWNGRAPDALTPQV